MEADMIEISNTFSRLQAVTLRTVIFMGSAKDLVAPWGGDKRLGDRVLTWVKNTLAGRTATCGPDTVKHEVSANDSCP